MSQIQKLGTDTKIQTLSCCPDTLILSIMNRDTGLVSVNSNNPRPFGTLLATSEMLTVAYPHLTYFLNRDPIQ